MRKDLISIFNLSSKEIWDLIVTARRLKSGKSFRPVLTGKSLGLIFEKPSTRTTVSFAVAMYQLGGFPLVLDARNLQRKRGETIPDTVRTLSRYLDAIMIRAFSHRDVEEFAEWATVPVINGLTDTEHPCQILGDLLTICEKKRISTLSRLKNIKVAFIGDGNNMANSWIAAAGTLGFTFVLGRPKGYGPNLRILEKACKLGRSSGGRITVTHNPEEAVKDADVIYTDVWISMGEEAERAKRMRAFKRFQVNAHLLRKAKRKCLVMHCLPANRGEEITSDVIEGPQSIIFDQAENRLHIQKAILLKLLK
ncbi:MAG: ornithine carbamoyltransferase [Elusimicrobiota bacterium]